ncbi:MAG: PIG-L family deacetylase [Bacteroidales bacterium]|nr:PIG-L family deacetylase [Bacteroidales bacterium]
MKTRVFALAAHPDDIEFGMSGTLILLVKAGCEIHYMNIANGSCGTAEYDTDTIVAIRLEEAKNAARSIGAKFHKSLAPDLGIFYNEELIARLSSVMRDVAPDILLIPSPQDYMEDHTNACRLAITAAFTRGMLNFPVNPPMEIVHNDVAVYHAQPHGNRDALNHLVYPDIYIDTSEVLEEKTKMLAKHKSQKEWLDRSQGFDAYLDIMKEHGRELGKISKQWEYAEGWRPHNPLGLCASDSNPLADLLPGYYFKHENK